MFDKFTSYLQFEKRYSEHTVLAYGQDLNAFVEFAEVKKISEFADLSSAFIRSWIVYLMQVLRVIQPAGSGLQELEQTQHHISESLIQ